MKCMASKPHVVPGLYDLLSMFFSMQLQLSLLKFSNLKKRQRNHHKSILKVVSYHSQLNEGQFINEFRLVLKFIDAIVLAHKSYGVSKHQKKKKRSPFFRNSPFMFHRGKKVICIWSNIRVSK